MPFRFIHKAQRHRHVALQRRLDPAPPLLPHRQRPCSADILHAQRQCRFISTHSLCTTSSPRNVCRTTCVTLTSTKRPIIPGEPRKLSTRLLSVRPATSSTSFSETPSTSTHCTDPSMDWPTASSCDESLSCRRFKRAAFTSCGVSSFISAAGVPGRGLY